MWCCRWRLLSEKDRDDLEFVCQLGVDWLALSFVQRAKDVFEARALADGRAAILSKIEKPAAVEAFEDILDASDGIMVARGDLGVELPVSAVPPIQKRLVRGAVAAAKPVIVATQMLESMIESPMPTRAEVSDVATAIYEGTDAIMLSAESAAGAYPIEAVQTMNNVAIEVEADPTYTRDHGRVAHSQGDNGGGRNRGRCPRDCRKNGYQGDLLFYSKRYNCCSDCARASRRADHRIDGSERDRAQAVPELGLQLCHDARTRAVQRRCGQRGPCGPIWGFCHRNRSDRGDCGRAVQRAGHDEYSACGPLRRAVDLQHRSGIKR